MVRELEAPCGLHCGICYLHRAINDDTIRALMSRKYGVPEEQITCAGCRAVSGHCPVIDEQCATYLCSRQRGVEFCSDCISFPCEKLLPCADRAPELPQNIKVFSLALRRERGEEEWRRSIVGVYILYFKGEMAIGHGPVLRE